MRDQKMKEFFVSRELRFVLRNDREVTDWLCAYGTGYLTKEDLIERLDDKIKNLVKESGERFNKYQERYPIATNIFGSKP